MRVLIEEIRYLPLTLEETIYTFLIRLGRNNVTLRSYFITPLEGCNETLHNSVTELHRQEFSYSAGVSDS